MTRFRTPLFAAAVLGLGLALAGCTNILPGGRDGFASSSEDGLDVEAMDQVITTAYTQIKERALVDPDIDSLFTTGLAGMAAIDPELTIKVADGHIRVAALGAGLGDAGPAPHDNISAWTHAAINAILFARKASPLLHVADEEAIYQAMFGASLAKLDTYSHYSGHLDAARNRLMRDGITGLGIAVVPVERGAVVQAMIRGGPADAAGIKIGDLIISVDGRPLSRERLSDIRHIIDGVVNTQARLVIRRAGTRGLLNISARRRLIIPDTVIATTTDGILQMQITSFNQRTAPEVERAVAAARTQTAAAGTALKGIVIDFRGDPGGLLDQGIETADLFLDGGAIAAIDGRHPASKQYYAAHRRDIAQGIPVVIMVDGHTASAAEIVTAALQDNGRATVVGTVTLGKGSVQTVLRLPNGGEIALTWAHETTPRGASLHGLGVLPDVCLAGDVTAADAIAAVTSDPRPTIDMRQRWRFPVDNATSHSALRAACPPESRAERDVDPMVARGLIGDPVLLARASQPDGAQLARKP